MAYNLAPVGGSYDGFKRSWTEARKYISNATVDCEEPSIEIDHWNKGSYECLNRFPEIEKTAAKEGVPCSICRVPLEDEAFVYESPARIFQFHGKCIAHHTGG